MLNTFDLLSKRELKCLSKIFIKRLTNIFGNIFVKHYLLTALPSSVAAIRYVYVHSYQARDQERAILLNL